MKKKTGIYLLIILSIMISISCATVTDLLGNEESGADQQTDLTAEESDETAQTDEEPSQTDVESADTPDEIPTGPPVALKQLLMLSADAGWALGEADQTGDLVLKTTNGGLSWESVTPPEPMLEENSILAADAAFIDMDHAWVLYEGSEQVWSTPNGGETWQSANVQPTGLLGADFFALDAQNGWLLCGLDAGMSQVYESLFRTANGGESWEKLLDPYTVSDMSSFPKTGWDFLDTDTGWMTYNTRGVSPSVGFQVTTDGGLSWQDMDLVPPTDAPDLFDDSMCYTHSPHMASASEGAVVLVCEKYSSDEETSYLYTTTNSGQTWTTLPYPGGEMIYVDGNTAFAVGTGLNLSEDGGQTWNLQGPLAWSGQFIFLDQQTGFSIARDPEDSFLAKTLDGGTTWITYYPVLNGGISFSEAEAPAAPASGQVAFLSCRMDPDNYESSNIFLVNLDGSDLSNITSGTDFVSSFDWSPDGQSIVYSSNQDGDYELYLTNLEDNSTTQLTQTDTDETLPVFSPDGLRIAYVNFIDDGMATFLYDLAAQDSTYLAAGLTPAWTPDGGQVLVFRSFDGVYAVNADGSGETNLIDSQENGFDWYPVFSPDGSQILIASNRHSPGDSAVEAAYVFSADGTLIEQASTFWGTPPYEWLPGGQGYLLTNGFFTGAELVIKPIGGEEQPFPLDDPHGWFPRVRP